MPVDGVRESRKTCWSEHMRVPFKRKKERTVDSGWWWSESVSTSAKDGNLKPKRETKHGRQQENKTKQSGKEAGAVDWMERKVCTICESMENTSLYYCGAWAARPITGRRRRREANYFDVY